MILMTRQLYVANINVVFGKEEEPLIERIYDIIIPALTSGIVRQASSKTKYIFDSVCLKEIAKDEWVIQGIIIKDTVLDVMSEYTQNKGLQMTEKHIPSSPYSFFMIYLKNHRMVLVKNQSGSQDIRSFTGTFKEILKRYVVKFNHETANETEKLPFPSIAITGIKTAASVKESLKDVEKINELVIKFFPLNSEWDYEPVYGGIDEKIRKRIQSKNGRMVFPSPQSKEGVAEMIEETEGLVRTELKVTYKSGSGKKIGRIKDNQISETMSVEITGELYEAADEIYGIGQGIKALNVQTNNHINDYNKFLAKQKE